MAIAFDAESSSATGTGTLSWTHTPVGTPRGVLVFVEQTDGLGDEVTGVTYGGVAMTEIAGSPNLHTTGERGGVHAFLLGASVPTGARTVVVSVDATGSKKVATALSVTAGLDVEVVRADGTINSDAVANPSVVLSLAGRASFAAIGFFSGKDDRNAITPLSGWTSQMEVDFGLTTAGVYTYDTIGTADVTAGWTQSVDDAAAIAVALSELAPVSGSSSKALAPVTGAATGTVEIQGTSSKTLAALTGSAQGVVGTPPVIGESSKTLAGLAGAATGAVLVQGISDQLLGALMAASTGTVLITGTSAITLAPLAGGASGLVFTPLPPGGLAVDASDRPATSIAWLFDIGGIHIGTRDCVVSGVAYFRALVTGPNVDRRLDQVFYGFQEISRVTIEAANPTGALDVLWTTEQRGVAVTLRRYDWQQAVLVTEFTGVVEQVELAADRILIHCVNLDLSVLDTMVPRTLITTALYGPNCPDAGKPEQKILGTCQRVPLPYVTDDVPGGLFWYLLSVGTGYTVTVLYRDRQAAGQYQALDTPEYEVRTDLVSGRTLVRTVVRQLKAGGGFHRLYADVTGPSSERNFARAIKNLYSDTVWGLSQPVNAGSFTTAEAALPANLVCDGVLNEQRPAKDWLNPLLSVRGMRPGFGASGWTLAVDTAPATAKMAVRDAPGAGERTMLRSGRRVKPTLDEQVSTYKLQYALDLPSGEFRLSAADRTVHATVGREKVDQHEFLRDRTAADLVACYRSKRLKYNADRIEEVEVTEEGRRLAEGDVVIANNPRLLITDTAYQVVAITKGSGRQRFVGLGWNADIYAYDPLTLPVVPLLDPAVTPPPVSSFSVSSSGSELATDGTVLAFFILQVVIPAVPSIEYIRVDVRKTGTATYGDAQPVHGTGTQLVRVTGLVAGQLYDFRAVAISGANQSSEALLLSQLAPGDTIAPAIPGTPTVSDKKLTVVSFAWSAPGDTDLAKYEWQVRTLANGGGSLTASGETPGPGPSFTRDFASIGYGVTRHFRVRSVDRTGNKKTTGGVNNDGWSNSVSFSLAAAVSGDRSPLLVDSQSIPLGVGGSPAAIFSHSLGAAPLVTVETDNPHVWVTSVRTTSSQVIVTVHGDGSIDQPSTVVVTVKYW